MESWRFFYRRKRAISISRFLSRSLSGSFHSFHTFIPFINRLFFTNGNTSFKIQNTYQCTELRVHGLTALDVCAGQEEGREKRGSHQKKRILTSSEWGNSTYVHFSFLKKPNGKKKESLFFIHIETHSNSKYISNDSITRYT